MRPVTSGLFALATPLSANSPSFALLLAGALALGGIGGTGCSRTDAGEARADSERTAAASASVTPAVSKAVYGAPIAAPGSVALVDVAKDPSKFTGKEVVVSGKVSAVCEHRGCWMELSEAGDGTVAAAHIKMAGHAFFVPRDAAGKQARVQAKVIADPSAAAACGDPSEPTKDGKSGCTAEAEKALGRPLAKLQLEASGVELF
jgi:hypothetical protein